MKKQVITCSILAGLSLAALPIFAQNAKSDVAMAATNVNALRVSTQINQFFGSGALLEIGGLQFNNNHFPTFYDSSVEKSSKVHFYNQYLEEQPVKFMGLGSSILVNQNVTPNYYGYILEIEAGFTFTVDEGEFTFNNTASFLCKTPNGVGGEGGYWWTTYTPTMSTKESSFSVDEGKSHKLDLTVTTSDTNPIVSYKSMDESIAQVDKNGNVTGVKEGTTTIKAYCAKQSVEYTVTVNKAVVPQSGIKVKTKTIETYLGYDFNLSDLEVVTMYGDEEGGRIEVTKEMISGSYDFNVIGEYNLVVTSGSFSDTFKLVVKDLPSTEIGNQKGFNFGSGSPWGTAFFFTTGIPDTAHYVNLHNEALEKVNSHILVNGEANKCRDIKNAGGGRYELWFYNTNFKQGDVIELLAGLPIYQFSGDVNSANHEPDYNTGKFVPVAKLSTTYKYVYTGTEWDNYIGEAESIELDAPSTVAVGEEITIKYTLSPAGTFGTPTFTSSDETIATVDGLGKVVGIKEGKVTITATLGSASKSVDITVLPQKEVKSAKFIDTPNYFSVVKDTPWTDFKPSLKKAQLVFSDDTVSPEFDVTENDYTISQFDTSFTGDIDVTVSLKYGGKTYQTTIKVNVYEYYDQRISEVAIVDWFIYSTFIQVPNTCANVANLTGGMDMIPGLYEGISYKRADGTPVNISVIYQLGANIALFPDFLFKPDGTGALDEENYNQFYLPGDTITIKANTPVYRWTGGIAPTDKDNNAMDYGTGEIVVDGYFTEDIQYRYDGNVWGVYVEYTDIEIKNDTLDMLIGDSKSAGATRVPSNATSGTFTYESSNPNVAKVSSSGVIKAISEGTCTITVKLSDEGRNEKVGTITVNVTDGIKTISFNGPIDVKKGTAAEKINWAKAEPKFVWASEKVEDADLTGATVSGYDPNKVGEQNVVVTVTKDGKQISGKAVINVTSSGCGGSIVATSTMISLVSLAGVALIALKKKQK